VFCLGVFSSRVAANDANEVQLSGTLCLRNETNIPMDNITHAFFSFSPLLSYRARKVTDYTTYTLQCYRGELAGNTHMCQTYPVQSLPYSMDANASCPFSNGICRSPFGNAYLDTGFLDSDKHFGINTNPRFLFRYTRHCAPLVTEEFSEVHTDPQNSSVRTIRYCKWLPIGTYQACSVCG
jgi:hypothetical protein